MSDVKATPPGVPETFSQPIFLHISPTAPEKYA